MPASRGRDLGDRARRAAIVCAAVALAIAVVTLIGWIFDVDALYRIAPNRPPMKPVTAIAVAILALATIVRASPPTPSGRIFVTTAGGLVAFGALVVITQYFFGGPSWIEQWIYEPLLARSYPGRVSPLSAIALFLLGAEMVIGDLPRFSRVAPAMSSSAGFIALVALAAHLYGTQYVYKLAGVDVIAVAVGTGVAVLLLSFAQLWSHPECAPLSVFASNRIGAFSARRLIVVVFAAPLLVGIFIQAARSVGFGDVPLALGLVAASSIPIGVILVVAHAHALDELEATHLENEERFTAFFQQSSDAIVIASPSGHCENVSDSAVALLGANYVGRPVTDLVAPRERARLLATLRALGEGATVRGEWTACTRRGEEIPVEVQAKKLSTGQWLIAARDVRDRQSAEENLARAHAAEQVARKQLEELCELETRERTLLQSVIDQLPEGIIITDENGAVASVNRSASAYARSGERVVFEARSPDGEKLPWEDLPLARAIAGHEVTVNRELAVRADGHYMPVLASATPIWGQNRAVLGAVIAFHDITEQKRNERMKEQWTSIIAHDLRQPIAVISVAAQMLKRRAVLPAEQGELVERMLNGCTNIERMVKDLLDASRIEAQRMRVERSLVDFEALVRGIYERACAVLHGVRIRLELETPLPRAFVDAGRVEQIVVNLLSNAAKYGTPGEEIVVGVRAIGERIEVRVVNHGTGIAPEELPRLFSRFERTRSARTSREGVGLGLYITKGLVEAHGGHISVESTPDHTTTFRFSLPASPGAELVSRTSRPRESRSSLSERSSRSSLSERSSRSSLSERSSRSSLPAM